VSFSKKHTFEISPDGKDSIYWHILEEDYKFSDNLFTIRQKPIKRLIFFDWLLGIPQEKVLKKNVIGVLTQLKTVTDLDRKRQK
jgi:hypothetical protein